MRHLLLSLTAALIAGLAWAGLPGRVHACSLAPIQVTEEWVRGQAGQADLIVVGEAGAEWPADIGGRGQRYFSSVLVAATLKGQPPESLVDVGPTGYLGPDCSGGPKPALGQRVLLFLRRGEPGPHLSHGVWAVSPAQAGAGMYVLEDGRARPERYGSAGPEWDAGALIEVIADAVDADPAQTEKAIRYARGEDVEMPRIVPVGGAGVAPEPDGAPADAGIAEAPETGTTSGRTAALAAGGGAAALLAGAAGLAAWRRRRAG